MHKLLRPDAPTCLNKFHHGRDNWGHVSSSDKDEIWTQLDQMQQHRCAYCECSIDGDKKSHIEHFRQRNRYPQGTFDWNNLFGSCNRPNSCGKHKDSCGSYEHRDLIKMDIEDPEDFFMFVSDGTIALRSGLSNHEKHRATETLRIFNLDAKHGPLRYIRSAAIKGYIDTAKDFLELLEMAYEFDEHEWRPLLEEELENIKLLPFATAIKHVLTSHK